MHPLLIAPLAPRMGGWQPHASTDGMPSTSVDVQSNLVAYGFGWLLCRQDGNWHEFTQDDGLPFAYVTCLAEDRKGTIWAGSLDEGLYYESTT